MTTAALLCLLLVQEDDGLLEALAKDRTVATVETARVAVTSGKSAADWFAPRCEKICAFLAETLKADAKEKLKLRLCFTAASMKQNAGQETVACFDPEKNTGYVLIDAGWSWNLAWALLEAYFYNLAPERVKDVPALLKACLVTVLAGHDGKMEAAQFLSIQPTRNFLFASRVKDLAGRSKLAGIRKLSTMKEEEWPAQEPSLWAVGYTLLTHKKTLEELRAYVAGHVSGKAAPCPVAPALDPVVTTLCNSFVLKVADREVDGGILSESRYYTIWIQKGTKRPKPAMDDKAILAELKDKMDLMYSRYAKAYKFDEMLPKRPRIFYYADEGNYVSAGGPRGSAAYYLPSAQKLVAFEYNESKTTTFQTMCHEGCHQFFDLAFPGFYEKESNPTWFSEGLAECFGSNEIKGGNLVIFTLAGPAADWTPVIQDAVANGQSTPFKALFAMSHAEFMSKSQLHYAQAWSICHFLWCAPSPFGAESGTYRDVVLKLMDGFKQGKERDAVYKEAFSRGGKAIDLDALEKEWKDYIKKLKVK